MTVAECKADLLELLEVWPMGGTFALQPEETVVVAGAYKGRVIDLIKTVYSSARVFGFDPQPWAIDEAEARVGFMPGVYLLKFGIGLADGEWEMGEWSTDACSFVNTGPGAREHGIGRMREIRSAFQDLGIDDVGLFVMNMEGYEFDLLEYMLAIDLVKKVDRLVVQFHHNFGNDGNYDWIREQLALTHEVVTDDAPRWVYWRRR